MRPGAVEDAVRAYMELAWTRHFYGRTGWAATGERRQDAWTCIPELRLRRQVVSRP